MNDNNTNTVINNLKKQLALRHNQYNFLIYKKAIKDVADTIFVFDVKKAIDINYLPAVDTHNVYRSLVSSQPESDLLKTLVD